MEVPQNRPTDPAPPETVQDMISDLSAQIESLSRGQMVLLLLVQDIHAETTGMTTAFHDINQHLAVIKADVYLASEQLTPLGVAIGEIEQRLARVEAATRGG